MEIIVGIIVLGAFAFGIGVIIGAVKGGIQGARNAKSYYARKRAEEQK